MFEPNGCGGGGRERCGPVESFQVGSLELNEMPFSLQNKGKLSSSAACVKYRFHQCLGILAKA